MKQGLKIAGWLCALLVMLSGGCKSEESGGANAGGAVATGDKSITVVWAEWPPADYLQELANEFTKESGIQVKVEQIPWAQFQDRVFAALAAQDATYDLIVGDSQWLGKAVSGGHYVDLTNWLKENVEMDQFYQTAVQAYAEYPKDSGKLYALPAEGDAVGFAYRKDLFEDPKEQAAFKQKYGYDLKTPDTWQQFRDIAEFFTRPDKSLYGAALYFGKDYDSVTMGFQQVLWSFGGELYDPQTMQVEGVLNSETGVKALEFFVGLRKFTIPNSETYYWNECLTAFQEGKVAMTMNYFAFFPGLLDSSKNPHAEHTGFFLMPGVKHADGSLRRYISIGGQGVSLSKYSKKHDLCYEFLKWFAKKENQMKWAQLGGFPCRQDVLESEEFLSAKPFNPVFAASFPHLRDFWTIPEYASLLESCQRHWNAAVVGQENPKQAMDAIAKEHTEILKKAGILK